MFTTQYPPEQLDLELVRRQTCPPFSIRVDPQRYRWPRVTIQTLRTELDHTPIDHPDREWREWELQLAERQVLHHATETDRA